MAFINRNFCKTFNLALNGTKTALATQECSEVIIKVSNGGSDHADIYDVNNPSVSFFLDKNQEFTFRGVSNANQLSATGAGTLYYRTQFFGSMTDL